MKMHIVQSPGLVKLTHFWALHMESRMHIIVLGYFLETYKDLSNKVITCKILIAL